LPNVTFILRNGEQRTVDAIVGKSLMFTAVAHLIDGVVADCGGFCTCATCHVYIDNQEQFDLPSPSTDEVDMLECASEPQANSRLSCQIEITTALDGLVVEVPASQG
jgi:2Fe-2S ferredoxin